MLLLAFSLATAFYMHAFWKESDAQMKMNQQAHFMKNVAMAGGALLALLLFAFAGDDLGLTITGPLFEF